MTQVICKSCVQEFDSAAGHDCPGIGLMTDPIGTAQERELIVLLNALGHDCDSTNGWEDAAPTVRQAADALLSRIAEVERLREALTPSAETKYAYLGEFKMPLVRVDECGDEYTEHVTVSWDVIKEIMAAILSRAALSQHRKL